ADCREQKRQAHVLLEEHGHARQRTRGKRKERALSSIELRERPKRNQDRETAVAVVLGRGYDAVDAQKNERRGEQQRQRPRGGYAPAQEGEREPPRQHRAQAAGDGGIEDVVKKNAAGDADDGGLDEKGEGCVREGEVAVGNLAEGDALRGVEDVAEIEEDRDV